MVLSLGACLDLVTMFLRTQYRKHESWICKLWGDSVSGDDCSTVQYNPTHFSPLWSVGILHWGFGPSAVHFFPILLILLYQWGTFWLCWAKWQLCAQSVKGSDKHRPTKMISQVKPTIKGRTKTFFMLEFKAVVKVFGTFYTSKCSAADCSQGCDDNSSSTQMFSLAYLYIFI